MNCDICSDCAKKLGLIWPEGHVATWNFDYCGECEEKKPVCDRNDWHDPNSKARKVWD